MQGSCRIVIAIIISLVSFSCLKPFNVQAKTYIESANFNHFTVFVKMVFYFSPDIPEPEQILIRWQQGMNNIWNNGQNLPTTYVFQLQKMPAGQNCSDYPEFHCLEVVKGKYTSSNQLATSVFSQEQSHGWGRWTSELAGKQAAHEVGHLMGLADEYHYEFRQAQTDFKQAMWVNDNIQVKGPQSIMAKTWGSVAAMPSHHQQIIQIFRKK